MQIITYRLSNHWCTWLDLQSRL